MLSNAAIFIRRVPSASQPMTLLNSFSISFSRTISFAMASTSSWIPLFSAIDCRTYRSFRKRLILRGLPLNFSYRIGVRRPAVTRSFCNTSDSPSSNSSRDFPARRILSHSSTSDLYLASSHSDFAKSKNKKACVSNLLRPGSGMVVCTIL